MTNRPSIPTSCWFRSSRSTRGATALAMAAAYYDRTLQRLRKLKPVVAIGLAYDEQRVDAVPVESYDERLDWVLTPSGPLHCLDS